MASFHSKDVKLQLDVAVDNGEDEKSCPIITFKKVKRPGMHGEGLVARIEIQEGQNISFVLRNDIPNHVAQSISTPILDVQQHDTQTFWFNFISQSKYKGRWREVVSRSLMILKMMTYGGSPDLNSGLHLLTNWQNLLEQSSPRRRSQSPRPSEAFVTGTTATAGSVTPVSPFTSCSVSVSKPRPTRTWSSSWSGSSTHVDLMADCPSCLRSAEKPISPNWN